MALPALHLPLHPRDTVVAKPVTPSLVTTSTSDALSSPPFCLWGITLAVTSSLMEVLGHPYMLAHLENAKANGDVFVGVLGKVYKRVDVLMKPLHQWWSRRVQWWKEHGEETIGRGNIPQDGRSSRSHSKL